MKKMLFLRTSTPARGDGSGPTFHEGKAYWMRNASANYWLSEGAAVEAPADMGAENEPPAEKRFAETVKIVPARPGRFNVQVNGVVANEQPLSAPAAETLRRDIITGAVAPPAATETTATEIADHAKAPLLPPDGGAAMEIGGQEDPVMAPDAELGEMVEASDPGLAEPEHQIVHLGFGRYNVVSADGAVVNDAPLSKRAAAELADSLASHP
ncbi:MAG: hypothetical protein KIS96_03545 [Bauldia sp.]|nr:hypothetical protein [Bauldia sp.]